MKHSQLFDKLEVRETSISLEHMLDNSKAGSGGQRDVNFLKYLTDNGILIQKEVVLKRTTIGNPEEYYAERYKKARFESNRHFLCRAIIQEELKKLGIATLNDLSVGDMNILRSNSSYDIVTEDFGALIDVGLTPARNYFRGLTDLKVKDYLITTYFDDYMDNIIFRSFTRAEDAVFISAVKDYQEGFKAYAPHITQLPEEAMNYRQPHLPE